MRRNSSWQGDLPGLRSRLTHQPAKDATLFADEDLTGQLSLAEEIVQTPGLAVPWTTDSQRDFDTAVAVMTNSLIINPNMAIEVREVDFIRKWKDEIPYQVRMFWKRYATSALPGEDEVPFHVGTFT